MAFSAMEHDSNRPVTPAVSLDVPAGVLLQHRIEATTGACTVIVQDLKAIAVKFNRTVSFHKPDISGPSPVVGPLRPVMCLADEVFSSGDPRGTLERSVPTGKGRANKKKPQRTAGEVWDQPMYL